MSETITVEHRGHEIRFSENDEVWRCWTLDLENASLAKLKRAIDEVEREARRAGGLPVFHLPWSATGGAVAVRLQSVDEDARRAWVVRTDKAGKTKREKVDFDRLVLDTPDNRAAIETHANLVRVASSAAKAAADAAAAIPRVTLADIAASRKEAAP